MKGQTTRSSHTVQDLAAFGLLLVSGTLAILVLWQQKQAGLRWFEALLLLVVAGFGSLVGLLLLRLVHRDRRMVDLFGWMGGLDRLLGGLSPPLTPTALAPLIDHMLKLYPCHCGWVCVLRAPGLLIRGEQVRRRYLPVISPQKQGGWDAGRAEALLRDRMDHSWVGSEQAALDGMPLHFLLIRVLFDPTGEFGAGLAVALPSVWKGRDRLTEQALTTGLTMLTQRIGGLLVEVMAHRDGLGMESLGMVMRVLAHEINNDLQGALNRLDGAWATDREEQLVDLRALLARAAHWSYLMREAPFLIDRQLPVECGRVSLRECLRQTVAETRVAWPDLSFVVDLPQQAGPLIVVGDGHLRSVLRNLVHNAASFSPETAPVGISVRVEGDFVHVLVQDEGPGVDPADVERVFAPLQGQQLGRRWGERVQHGMGVGLTLSRAIARVYGGELRCHSNHERSGGLFEVLLPLAQDE